MAKKASSGTTKPKSGSRAKSDNKPSRAVATTSSRSSSGSDSEGGAGEAFIRLLQSPLVAELMTVAATAALAALAEHGFSRGDGSAANQRRAGRAVKEAGKAAAAAIGRRLSTEVDEIRKAARDAREREPA